MIMTLIDLNSRRCAHFEEGLVIHCLDCHGESAERVGSGVNVDRDRPR